VEEMDKPKGLGDTLKEILDETGVSIVFTKVQSALGVKDCGCKKRQEKLNEMFPYNTEE
jgi:hypothetical protein